MLKLMVVDDNISDLEAIQQIVNSISFFEWVGGFANPHEALSEMMRKPPDIVITTVELPEMNGLSLTRKMQEVLPWVHVIIAARNSNFATEAYEVGARGYLIKPFRQESLLKLIGNVFSF
ncbi:response regulator transcription factor [Paenibacillus crassostreae]|uniref:Response regulatory domain-containing protein n=1 Tax=Paenibacillus crassostreae TaxID=1763538 RepID=A0A162KPG7_9BACL|nr:response regulator [Paenibacillus crassostreae]AOZ93138.1 hypothetical protein LPB68_13570 [Paenibacillus crassostreae]OAB71773.1 hypothetical protein PNBC_17320 [Paenibacillus crassostreae]